MRPTEIDGETLCKASGNIRWGGVDLDGAFLGVHFCWGKSASKSVQSEIGQRKESDKAH